MSLTGSAPPARPVQGPARREPERLPRVPSATAPGRYGRLSRQGPAVRPARKPAGSCLRPVACRRPIPGGPRLRSGSGRSCQSVRLLSVVDRCHSSPGIACGSWGLYLPSFGFARKMLRVPPAPCRSCSLPTSDSPGLRRGANRSACRLMPKRPPDAGRTRSHCL